MIRLVGAVQLRVFPIAGFVADGARHSQAEVSLSLPTSVKKL